MEFIYHFPWQAQYLVKFKRHFSWQAQYLLKFKCHFSWQAGTVFGEGHVSLFVPGAVFALFVAGAVFGEVEVSLFVAGAALGEIWNASRSAKCCHFQ